MEKSVNLCELEKLISKPLLIGSDIVHMMVLIRVLMEEHNLQSKYRYLNLYCNWVVHPKLSQSVVCLRILEDLTDVLIKYTSLPPEHEFRHGSFIDDLHAEVNEALGIQKLRSDILNLFADFSLPGDGLRNSDVWKDFSLLLISNLFERTVEFPEVVDIARHKRVRAIYDSIHRKARGNPKYAVSKFSFLSRDRVPRPYPNIDVYWCIETDAKVSIQGPL
jgi:hypothetical protein